MDEHKTDFDKLIKVRVNLNYKITSLENTLSEMKNKYRFFIKNNFKKIYLYSLDSFFFQYKILHVEFEHYKRVLALINNRMYGDYYKLFIIIITQTKDSNLCINSSIDDVLVYKDLDPTYDYTVDDVTLLFGNIVNATEELRELHKTNSDTIMSNNSNNAVGFSIAAFFTTLKYENIILNQQINMYLDLITFYQASQMGHYSKALADIVRFSDDISGKVLVNYQVEIDALVKPSIQDTDTESEPITTTESITSTTSEPVVVAEEPAVVAEEPVVVTEEPAVVAEEPAVVAEEPAVVAEEPGVVTEEPAVVAEEPAVVTEEPVVVAEEPAVVAEEPAVVTEEPVVVAEEPAVVESDTE